MRAAIAQVDDKLPIISLTSLRMQTDDSLRQEKLLAQLVSFFGVLGLLLSCVGLYGIMAHAVVRRTNEIGIRMALGAERRNIIWMVLKESLLLVGVGLVIGVPAAWGAAHLISSQLFGLNPSDPVTLVAGGRPADFGWRAGGLSAGEKSVARRSVSGAALRMISVVRGYAA